MLALSKRAERRSTSVILDSAKLTFSPEASRKIARFNSALRSFAPSKQAPEKSVSTAEASSRSASVKSAPSQLAAFRDDWRRMARTNLARRRSAPVKSAVLRFAPVKFALGKEPRASVTPSKRDRERSEPSQWVRVRSAPARLAPTKEQLWSDADLKRAPTRKALEKSRKSSTQFSKTAPGAEAPSSFASTRTARERSAAAREAPSSSARERSARFKSLPERSWPERPASVRSGVTLALRARQAVHSADRSNARCSGLGIGVILREVATIARDEHSRANGGGASQGDRPDSQGPAWGAPDPLHPDVGGVACRAAGAAPGQDLLRAAGSVRHLVPRGRSGGGRRAGARNAGPAACSRGHPPGLGEGLLSAQRLSDFARRAAGDRAAAARPLPRTQGSRATRPARLAAAGDPRGGEEGDLRRRVRAAGRIGNHSHHRGRHAPSRRRPARGGGRPAAVAGHAGADSG